MHQKKLIRTNFHTHTSFCDGSSQPEAYIKQALQNNFVALGFTAHAPLPFQNSWSLPEADLPTYCQTIRQLKAQYQSQLEIYLSLEIDYIPGVSDNFSVVQQKHQLDYVLGAVHLVKNPSGIDYWFIDGPIKNYDAGLQTIFKNDIQWGVNTYFEQLNEMIVTQKPDIIAHFDKIKMNNQHRYFHESDTWYKKLLQQTLQRIAKTNCIVEVNTRGIYTSKYDALYPSIEVLIQCFDLNIPLTISADAHKPTDLNAHFSETEKTLKNIGYKTIKVLRNNAWVDWEI
ncbi:MAG: histidinol-phosphatase [Bacteroidota bacterium]